MTPDQWHRPTRCTSGTCTLVRHTTDGTIQVADSKLGDTSPILTFDPDQWRAFIDAVKGSGL